MSPLMPNSLNVNQIITACLKGDRSAQQALFKIYAGKMMTVCRRYCSNTAEAEDLLQEGFIRVFSYLQSFENTGSFEGWLRRIFVNVCLKSISKKSLVIENIDSDVSLSISSTENDVISKLSEEHILQLIEELPEGYRTVFNLFVIEGYAHKEIADMFGIEESTSRSQLLKARKLLQDKIIELQKIAI
jgi:RNA polymerase sigma-70 factor (ECF subfamily)